MTEMIATTDLKTHPLNATLYPESDVAELTESMLEHGFFEDQAIGYVVSGEDRVIVNGHRRWLAAQAAKLPLVPCQRLHELEGDPLAIERRLILSNKHRNKTPETIVMEITRLVDIESKLARKRQLATTFTGGDKKEPKTENIEKPLVSTVGANWHPPQDGKTNKVVADQLGVSSRTVARATKVTATVDKLKAEGREAEVRGVVGCPAWHIQLRQ